MGNHYNNFPKNQKISIIHSMQTLVRKFLHSYEWDLSLYENDEELLNDVYFYWLRTSASKEYVWCKEYNDLLLSNEFAYEMKAKLKIYLYKILFSERQQEEINSK